MRTEADNRLIQRLNTLTVEWMQRAMDADMVTEVVRGQLDAARERTEDVREALQKQVERETTICAAAVKDRDEREADTTALLTALDTAPWYARRWVYRTVTKWEDTP